MNEKDTRHFFTFFIISIIIIIASGAGCFFLGRADSGNRDGIEQHLARERELLARIGEYQQREQDRIAREGERVAREAERIEAARERIERLETAIGAVRGLDRRTSDLLQALVTEINLLADYFRGSRDSFNNGLDSAGSE
jgi:hypothetical protein